MLAFWPDLSGQNDSALGMLHPAQTLWAMNK
jgi:hypothetical protein